MSYTIYITFMQGEPLIIPCKTQYSRKLLMERLLKEISEGKKTDTIYNNDNEVRIIVRLDNINFIKCADIYEGGKINGREGR